MLEHGLRYANKVNVTVKGTTARYDCTLSDEVRRFIWFSLLSSSVMLSRCLLIEWAAASEDDKRLEVRCWSMETSRC